MTEDNSASCRGVSRLGRLHRGVLEGEQSKQAKSSTVQVQTSLDPPVLKQSATQSPGSEHRHFFSFLFSNFNFVKKKSWGHLGGSVGQASDSWFGLRSRMSSRVVRLSPSWALRSARSLLEDSLPLPQPHTHGQALSLPNK